jgi:hypothetical protein
MTDFRALCTDLADELHGYKVANPMHCRALLDRALTALSLEGDGVGASADAVEEVAEAIYNAMRFDRDYDTPRWDKLGNSNAQEEARHTARALLARYGTHPRPIPVAERPLLKRDPFSDKLGRCWCGIAACVDQTGGFDVHMPASWELREPCPEDDCLLPAAAIPLPEGEP